MTLIWKQVKPDADRSQFLEFVGKMMAKIFIALVLNCFLSTVFLQKLCSDKPPNDKDPKDCCKLPSIVDAAVNQVCIQNYSKNTQKQVQESSDMPKGNCVSECLANQTKIYRGNGMIDRDQLARIFLNSVSGDREWGSVVASAVDVCINETRLRSEEFRQIMNMKNTFAGEIICHPISGYVMGCMNTEMFRRCPNMTQSVECNALQQYSVNCHISVKYDTKDKEIK